MNVDSVRLLLFVDFFVLFVYLCLFYSKYFDSGACKANLNGPNNRKLAVDSVSSRRRWTDLGT